MVRAIAEAMFADDGNVENSRLDGHVEAVDVFVSAASRAVRIGLRIALWFIRLAPILFFVRLTTLERLGVPERVALLTRIEGATHGPLSLAFIGWRTVMALLFYEDAEELQAIGYGEQRARHRRVLPMVVPVPLESGVRAIEQEEQERGSGEQEVA